MWIMYGVLSHLCWAGVNIGDKFLLSNKIQDPRIYLHLVGTCFGVIGLIGVLALGMPVVPPQTLALILAAGVLWFFGGLPYVFAVQQEEVTRINIWWNLVPVFSIVLAWSLFHDTLTARQITGVALLLCAAGLATVHLKKGISFNLRALSYMTMACLAYALYAVFLHEALQRVSFPVVFVWTSCAIGIAAQVLLIVPSIRRSMRTEVLYKRKTVLATAGVIALGDQAGSLLNQAALSLAAAGLVFSLEGLQVFFVFLITALLTYLRPGVLRESYDARDVFVKLLAAILLILGIVIVA